MFVQAAKAEFASVILWDTSSWKQIQTLEGHALTVTHIEFSHDSRYLLTVSRDRTWILYTLTTQLAGKSHDFGWSVT